MQYGPTQQILHLSGNNAGRHLLTCRLIPLGSKIIQIKSIYVGDARAISVAIRQQLHTISPVPSHQLAEKSADEYCYHHVQDLQVSS